MCPSVAAQQFAKASWAVMFPDWHLRSDLVCSWIFKRAGEERERGVSEWRSSWLHDEMQRRWQAKGIWAASDSWRNSQNRVGSPWPPKTQKLMSKAEDTAQWWGVCFTHLWLCSDAQCVKGKETEFNLRANSCVSGEKKSGICSSFRTQGKRKVCDLLFP